MRIMHVGSRKGTYLEVFDLLSSEFETPSFSYLVIFPRCLIKNNPSFCLCKGISKKKYCGQHGVGCCTANQCCFFIIYKQRNTN